MLSLEPSEVHLWLAHYERVDDERTLREYHKLMTEAERAQMVRFYFENDRRRYLVTRALVRSTLSRYAGVPAAHWQFVNNAYGRPAIAGLHGDACELSFNISHTRSLIALAITRNVAVGVDVENVVARAAPVEIADSYFSAQETAALTALERAHQQLRFFEYWTFKESYIKARGMGLSIPLDKFTFSYPSPTSVALSIDAELGDDAGRWLFWQLRPDPDYLLAICVEKQAGITPKLIVQPLLPAHLPAPAAALLRRSE